MNITSNLTAWHGLQFSKRYNSQLTFLDAVVLARRCAHIAGACWYWTDFVVINFCFRHNIPYIPNIPYILDHVTSAETLIAFRHRLKTFLFQQSYFPVVVLAVAYHLGHFKNLWLIDLLIPYLSFPSGVTVLTEAGMTVSIEALLLQGV